MRGGFIFTGFRRGAGWAVGLGLLLPGFAADRPEVGRPLPAWQRGQLDIHQFNTATGDAAFFILPDGTTFLLDAGAVDRSAEKIPPQYDSPQRPDTTLRPGQSIARYIHRVHPDGARGELDYVALTHFHGDHIGTVRPDSPRSAAGGYQLTGITDVAEEVKIHALLDRGWPDYDFPAPSGGAMMQNYRAFVKWQVEHRGLKAERFEAGRVGQIALRRDPSAYPDFEIRNLAANGYVWTGTGTATRNRYPAGMVPGENNCSLAFRLTYGAFTYFNGGDMAGILGANSPAWDEMESAVAWVTGPVDIHVLNHHGWKDSANAFFLSVLQPRVHILSTYASSEPSPDVMRRLLSERVYPGPRDVFMTNSEWPGRRAHMVKLFGEADTAWLLQQMKQIASSQGHVVVRVEPGGAHYHLIVLDDSRADGDVTSVHGPYTSRGATK